MAVITLTTDWGIRDPYVAAFKGLLLRKLQSLQIVDVSHSIQPHDRLAAAYVLSNSYGYFPDGSVHYVGLNSLEGARVEKGSDYLIVESEKKFFIGADCGIFAMVLLDKPRKIWRLAVPRNADQEELQLFLAENIIELLKGTPPSELGDEHASLEEAYFTKAVGDNSGIRGSVIYIDGFGNVVFNITRGFFESHRNERGFSILLRRASYKISEISKRFDTVADGDLLALFNQDGYLEVAVNKGNASQLIGLKMFDPILIEFHDHPHRQDELHAGEGIGVS
ncbi:MAG: hypothetical protein RL213_100 [Bacteroidota bacterium]|jgi:S-adenosylmethionine hydrolase